MGQLETGILNTLLAATAVTAIVGTTIFDMTSDPQYENGVEFEEATIVLKLRNDGWGRRILDAGLEGYYNDDRNPGQPAQPIRDANGDPIQQPCMLDGFGSPISGQAAKSRIPVFLEWNFKNPQAFASLPFWS